MEKEKVLEYEIISTNDAGWAVKLKQNTDVLKRRRDTEYSRAYIYPCWDIISKRLYTYGNEEYDDLIFTVPKNDIVLFSNKIDKINEKYGIPKKWRANKGAHYFRIDFDDFTIRSTREVFSSFDNFNYEIGNYFETKKEAEIYSEKIKKILKERE